MKNSKGTWQIILGLFIAQILCLFVPQTIFCQTETLDGVQYTPPKGWAKTPKQGAAVYTVMDKTTNAFCVLTVYASTPSAGSPQKDFANEWNELVVKPFKADPNPKTETQVAPDGWQGTAGGAEIDMTGIKSIAILTVFTGFGKTASVLTIFNDQSYLAQMQTFLDGIKLDKKAPVALNPPSQKAPDPTVPSSDFLDFDPFPDKPHVQPQQPLVGRIRKNITMAYLAGAWEIGGASVQEYVSSSTQSYSSVSFFGKKYTIRPDGGYESKFQGRASNTTIRESDSGSIILSSAAITVGDTITLKSKQNPAMRYQFIAYMAQPNGAAVLSLIYIGDKPPLDYDTVVANCSHPNGYVSCMGGEEWVRIPK